MRKLLVILLVFGVMLPASAATCTTGSVTWVETTPGHLSPRWQPDEAVEGLGTAIVGQFFWIQTPGNQVISYQIPAGTATITACDDGTVTFQAAPASNNDTESPILETVDVPAYWRARGYNVWTAV